MKKITLLIIGMVISFLTFSQLQQKVWHLNGKKIDFTSGSPVLSTFDAAVAGSTSDRVTNSITDDAGNLILMVRGLGVYTSETGPPAGTLSPNGFGGNNPDFNPHEVSIIPVPSSDCQYYIVYSFFGSTGEADPINGATPGYCYSGSCCPISFYQITFWSKFDVNTSSFISQGNQLIGCGSPQTGMAVSRLRGDNTRDLYLTNFINVKKYEVNASGIVLSNTYPIPSGIFSTYGTEADLSPDESKLWFSLDQTSIVAHLDNNGELIPTAGNLGNGFTSVNMPGYVTGLEFSPDGTKGYVAISGSGIYQVNGNNLTINNLISGTQDYSRTELEMGYHPTGDYKIYAVSDADELGFVVNPNGLAPSFTAGAVADIRAGQHNSLIFTRLLPDQIDSENYSSNILSISGQTDVCYESTLTASPGYSNYIWSNGDTGEETTVTTSGTYTVTATSPSGCSFEASIDINIWSSPKIALASTISVCDENFQPICGPFSTTTYNFTYQWYYNDLVTQTSILVTNGQCLIPSQYGSYTIVVTNQYGCASSATVEIVEGFGPEVAIKPVQYCGTPPLSVGLPGSLADALSYVWTYDDGTGAQIVAGAIGYQVPFQGDGQYCVTINWSDANVPSLLGCTSEACFTVGQFCEPTISYCVQDCEFTFTPSLVAPAGATVTYFWDFGNGQTSTDMIPSVQFQNNGVNTVTLTVTIDDGFNITTETQTITVFNDCPTEDCIANADFNYQQVGVNPFFGPRHYVFSNLSSYGPAGSTITYEWVITQNGFPYGAYTTAGLDLYLPGGKYEICLTVTVTNPNGFVCTDTYCRKLIIPTKPKVPGNGPGKGGVVGPTIRIHPNPSNGRFNMTLSENIDAQTPVNVSVINMQGIPVHNETVTGRSQFQIDIADEPDGTYLVGVQYEDQYITKQIVLQR